MTDVKGMYRTGLLAQIEVLEAARSSWQQAPEDSAAVVRRTASALRESASQFGFEELSAAAAAAASAPDAGLDSAAETLLDALRVASQDQASRAQPQERILVVSSSTELRAKVSRRFPGADVVPAPSVAEAQRVLALEVVSGIVVDLVLPEHDGRRFVAELRRDPTTSELPIVVLAPARNGRLEAECASLEVAALVVDGGGPDALTEALAALTSPPSQRQGGLADPSELQEAFRKIRSRASLSEQPLTVAVLQIDGLDKIEEEKGSWAALAIRDRVAELVAGALRKNDILARWTNGEMVALLVDTQLEGARRALVKARQAVSEKPVEGTDGPVSLSLSAGAAELLEVETLEHALAEADRYLLQARDQGGDRISDARSEGEAAKRRILVLEDDELVAFLAKQRLGRAGFEVTHVRSAGEAREHEPPDLWVVDTSLPDAGLSQLFPELRGRGSAPILAVIPAADRGEIRRALELGAEDYIVRPFDPLELQSRAQRLLRRPQIREESS